MVLYQIIKTYAGWLIFFPPRTAAHESEDRPSSAQDLTQGKESAHTQSSLPKKTVSVAG